MVGKGPRIEPFHVHGHGTWGWGKREGREGGITGCPKSFPGNWCVW